MNYEALQETIKMFLFLGAELTILFLIISYFVGILQEKIPPEKIQKILSDDKGSGYIVSALLGAITPFCSCSTIPFLKGLIRANAGFGTMMTFLFASPLLNPIIIGLFVVSFGWKVTIFYFVMAMTISILAGFILDKLGFKKYIKDSAYITEDKKGCCGAKIKKPSIWKKVWKSTWSDFKKVLPYLFVGILIGSVIYGFIPSEWIASVASKDNVLAVPISAIIGVPLYIRAEAVIPLSAALMAKGMSGGAVIALIIGSAGASLTEVILLKSIFKTKMIYAFLLVIFSMAIISGYLFNFMF